MKDGMEAKLRDWTERLGHADALFKQGNITGAAKLAHGVEDEVEAERKRAGVGSEERRAYMQVLKRARATLERFEFAAGIDDDEDDEEG